MREDLVDKMKPGDFRLVSHHKVSWSHIQDKPPVSKGGVLMRMPANSRSGRVVLFPVLLLFVVVAFAPGQARQQVADKSGPSANGQSAAAPVASAPSSDASKYVGAETCKTCHEEIYNAWEKTPHWKTTLNNKGPSHQGCEGCHGPGADHVAGGGDKTKIFVFEDHSRQETSTRCLKCHGEGHEQSHFAESAHSSSDVGCLDCHSPHHAKESQRLLVQSQPQLCYGCHTSAKADFAKPCHHRVNEGLVQCNDCHNPHGTATVRQVRSPAERGCHLLQVPCRQAGALRLRARAGEDRGLQRCHTPHGSTNPRLLKVSLVNMLCLQCHTFSTTLTAGGPIGPAHNQSAKYQACTMCHTQIHGSNFSNVFFK